MPDDPPPPTIRTTGYEVVALDSIEPHPENVNEGDVGAISSSIDALGFYGAILVRKETRVIIAGEHRWRAAQAQGMTEVPVLWTDAEDDDEAIRMMLSENRTARLGRDDPHALSRLLTRLAATPAALSGTGFDGDDLDRLLADLTVDAPLDFPSVGDVGTDHRCPACGYEWSGNPQPGGDRT